jgi:hypothetical protein
LSRFACASELSVFYPNEAPKDDGLIADIEGKDIDELVWSALQA